MNRIILYCTLAIAITVIPDEALCIKNQKICSCAYHGNAKKIAECIDNLRNDSIFRKAMNFFTAPGIPDEWLKLEESECHKKYTKQEYDKLMMQQQTVIEMELRNQQMRQMQQMGNF